MIWILVRYLEVIHMPRHRHLVTFNHRICNTWVVGIDHKTIGLEAFPKFLVENQRTL